MSGTRGWLAASARFAEPDPGCGASGTGPSACPCPQGQLARPPPLLQACSLIQSLRGSPPSRRAPLGGPCAGCCLSFRTPAPFFAALRAGRLTLGNQGPLNPQAPRWAPPVGAVAECGGAAGRVFGVTAGWLCSLSSRLTASFFLIYLFNWRLTNIAAVFGATPPGFSNVLLSQLLQTWGRGGLPASYPGDVDQALVDVLKPALCLCKHPLYWAAFWHPLEAPLLSAGTYCRQPGPVPQKTDSAQQRDGVKA